MSCDLFMSIVEVSILRLTVLSARPFPSENPGIVRCKFGTHASTNTKMKKGCGKGCPFEPISVRLREKSHSIQVFLVSFSV
jgi:hypothetical protein